MSTKPEPVKGREGRQGKSDMSRQRGAGTANMSTVMRHITTGGGSVDMVTYSTPLDISRFAARGRGCEHINIDLTHQRFPFLGVVTYEHPRTNISTALVHINGAAAAEPEPVNARVDMSSSPHILTTKLEHLNIGVDMSTSRTLHPRNTYQRGLNTSTLTTVARVDMSSQPEHIQGGSDSSPESDPPPPVTYEHFLRQPNPAPPFNYIVVNPPMERGDRSRGTRHAR